MNDGTNLTGLGLAFLVAMAVLTFALPRRAALVPLFLSTFYVTLGQVATIGGLHFTLVRIVMLLGWVRVLAKREQRGLELNEIDRAVIFWSASCFVMGIILVPNGKGFQYELGEVYNAIGLYFLARVHLRNAEDLTALLKQLVWILLPLSLLMFQEHRTGNNIFSVFGGVMPTSVDRGNSYRAQGPFTHSILAGQVGACMMPLFLSLWWENSKTRPLAVLGVALAILMVFSSHSSGPLMSFAGVLVAFTLWPIRFKMRAFRRGLVVYLLLLQCVMKTPVWFLIAKIADLVGGDGYHRSALIDVTIKHFDEWWLKGTTYTAHWYPNAVLASNPDMIDITNEYIHNGLSGGLVRFVLFMVIIVRCFRRVGFSLRQEQDRPGMVWMRGCALMSHIMAFFSVSYFDQIDVLWFFTLALISTSLPTPVLSRLAEPEYAETSRSLHSAGVMAESPSPQAGL